MSDLILHFVHSDDGGREYIVLLDSHFDGDNLDFQEGGYNLSGVYEVDLPKFNTLPLETPMRSSL